ncbi:MAG: hypothetical protein ISQ32_04840 [Rickettsiales bacterium]|nr:hypothetical protein [Rickettsiales bacterium]
MHKLLSLFFIIIFLVSCSFNRKASDLNMFKNTDFQKNCQELEIEIENLLFKKKKTQQSKNLTHAKNITFYILAVPTAFMSLLLLSSDKDAENQLYILNKRINHLEDLMIINSCQKDQI